MNIIALLSAVVPIVLGLFMVGIIIWDATRDETKKKKK